jgi:hypothetical protein
MKRGYVSTFLVLLLGLGFLIVSGCAGTQPQTRDRSYQPGEDSRPAWYRISPPGT